MLCMLFVYCLLFVGVSKEDFAKLMQHSEIPVGERWVW